MSTEKLGLYWYTCLSICPSMTYRTHLENWEVGVVLVHLSVCLSINDLQNSPWVLRSWGCTGTPVGLSVSPSTTCRTHLENWEVGVVLVHLSVCMYVHQWPVELTLRTEKLGLYWYTCRSVHLSVSLSVNSITHLEYWEVGVVLVHLSVYLSINDLQNSPWVLRSWGCTGRPVCLYVCLSVYLSINDLQNSPWELRSWGCTGRPVCLYVCLSVYLSINYLQNSPWELRSWGCTGTPVSLSVCLSVNSRTHLEYWEVGVVLVDLL